MKNINRPGFYLPLFIFLLAITLGCLKIDHPGLYHDELLFGNAAVGGKTNTFVRTRILGFPVLLMSYIGALKSWIYYPIFYLLQVNYWTIRFPSLFIGLTGGALLVLALRKGFGRSAAISGALMILLDPVIILHSRLDWGPNALMFFFRGLLVFSIVGWIKTKQEKWIWLALAAGILGIFDKLNFIWLAFAAAGSLVFCYSSQIAE